MSLLTALSDAPHTFLQPTSRVTTEAIALVKSLLDPLASDVAESQKARRDNSRRKRKREDEKEAERPLQLRAVYTNGVAVKQVWEQARRILDAACAEVERAIPLEKQTAIVQQNGSVGDISEDEELDPVSADAAEDLDESDEEGDATDGLSAKDAEPAQEENELTNDDLSEEDIEEGDDDEEGLSEGITAQQEIYQPDPNGLNDGFFSIDDFNRKSQFLEQMDARGDEENPSDEDEVDWDADPMSLPVPGPGGQGGRDAVASDTDDDAQDGPTFGNAGLDAPDSDEDVDDEDVYVHEMMPGLSNTNEIRYADFFEPPPQKPSKTKRMRALPKTQPSIATSQDAVAELDDDALDADIERAMNDVNRDIFASDSEVSGTDEDSDAEISKSKNLSTHEKQRAKIAAEIRRLEAANIAKRDWTLSGEARATERPLNSLIDENLEFERVGKPVPVITADISEEIEQLIKRRILAREFDEVIRRRPDAFGGASELQRGRAEVDDTQPQTGLAEIYEQDHLRSTDPGYVDNRSAATKKQHAEIDKLWREVSYQLDLLSNMNFKPKRLDLEVKTVEDKPKISMEDARPVGEGIGVEDSMLAPQEVYKAGDSKREGEVIRKSGASTSKEEMSREEKLRRRRREKERQKKGKANAVEVKKLGAPVKKGKKEEKQSIIDELRKGNVKVIDKKGDLQKIGKENVGARTVSSSALKL